MPLHDEMPFPLASGRYEVGPGMRRLAQEPPGETGHFWPDDHLRATLEAKLAVLKRAPGASHLFAPALTDAQAAGVRAALQAAFHLLANEHPALATVEADGVMLHHLGIRLSNWSGKTPAIEQVSAGWRKLQPLPEAIFAWLESVSGLRRLGDALGLAVQEDLALTRGPEAGESDVLEWLHVCLPSNWAPAEKIGLSFTAVHEPVVHNQRLLASQAQIVRAMIQGGPFVRNVWGIDRDGVLCHNPQLHQAPAWPVGLPLAELARRTFLRVERQTTYGLPDLNRSLFTIRYWVAPLPEAVGDDPWRRERLASALAGMDEGALRYKGLTPPVRDQLVAWARAMEPSTPARPPSPGGTM